MSYDIIRSITIKDAKVFINSASNNVYPRHFYTSECPKLTALLNDQGRDAVDKAILHEYWSGMFKGGSNDYEKAAALFRTQHGDKVRWENTALYDGEKVGDPCRYGSPGGVIEYSRDQVDELLLECYKQLKNRDKSKKYVILINGYGYYLKSGSRRFFYTQDKARAKTFDSLEATQIAAMAVKNLSYEIQEATT